MNNTTEANSSSTGSSVTVFSKAERIAWCSAFILTSVFIVVGNLLTIVLFAVNKRLRKRSLFLVINMAFADLMLGALSLPIYVYDLWIGGGLSMSLSIFYTIVDTIFFDGSLISAAMISGERFYAIYWPLKHRTLSMRTYRIVIFMSWTIALLVTAVVTILFYLTSVKNAVYASMPFAATLGVIVCGSNIGIWRKFQHEGVASQQQNRASQNKLLTKTLLFVSILSLLSWLPFIIMNYLIVFGVPISWRFFFMVNVLNYSSSFVNPIVYALRIPEFRQALGLCCYSGRQAATDMELIERRKNRTAAMTGVTQLTTSQPDPSHLQMAFEQEVMDTKL